MVFYGIDFTAYGLHRYHPPALEFIMTFFIYERIFSVYGFIMIKEEYKTTTTPKNHMTKADVKNVENSVIYASENIQNLHITFHETTIAVTMMTMTMAMTTIIIVIITTTMIN